MPFSLFQPNSCIGTVELRCKFLDRYRSTSPLIFFPTGEANIKVSRIKNWKDCDEDGLWTGVLLPVTGHPETPHSFPSRFVLGRLVARIL